MKRVLIDCERNDWDDIKYGGPQYLGFDFVVDDSENNEDLENFLRKTLKINGHGCISSKIYEMDKPKVWTREEIEEHIKNTTFY